MIESVKLELVFKSGSGFEKIIEGEDLAYIILFTLVLTSSQLTTSLGLFLWAFKRSSMIFLWSLIISDMFSRWYRILRYHNFNFLIG
jgi:hypothetical protein